MLIRAASDLHTEFWNYNKIPRMLDQKIPPMDTDKETVLLLPGDIGTFARYPSSIKPVLAHLAKRFKRVLYSYGNHEWYNSAVWGAEKEFWKGKRKPVGVRVMDDDYEIIDDVVFVGATLWTDFDSRDELSMHAAERGMNDFVCIRTGARPEADQFMLRNSAVLTPELTVQRHYKSRKFIFQLCKIFRGAKKVVVMTHHCPSELSVHTKYRGDLLNHAFYSDLSAEIKHCGPTLWFHGHTHESFNYTLGETRVICNPFGYHARVENRDYNPNLLIEI